MVAHLCVNFSMGLPSSAQAVLGSAGESQRALLLLRVAHRCLGLLPEEEEEEEIDEDEEEDSGKVLKIVSKIWY